MIVYGDPSYRETFPTLRAQLRNRVNAVLESATVSLDALRELVIFAGQVQQAALDALPEIIPLYPGKSVESLLSGVVHCLAFAFIREWGAGQVPRLPTRRSRVREELQRAARYLAEEEWTALPQRDLHLTVKLPEGFAFYALYPEQYCVSTWRWIQEHPSRSARLCVVGIRSIGTSLSACVSSIGYVTKKHTNSWAFTVRLGGHPFERQCLIDPVQIRDAEWALVVDEGPGASGSSMASVAQALCDAGIVRDNIAFLPGHGGEPGGQGNETTKQWWADASRYFTPLSDLRWNGLALPEVLSARTLEWAESRSRPASLSTSAAIAPNVTASASGLVITRCEDMGGGLWRISAYAEEADWPAACAAFARPKYRVTLSDGRRVLWKFAGLATVRGGHTQADTLCARLQEYSADGWTHAPLENAMGFVATEWLDGKPLTRADGNADVLTHIGRYIAAVAGEPLLPDEQASSLTRLADMLYWNTWESLGEAAAETTRAWSARMRQQAWLQTARTYGDGHLAPHEWLRLDSNGRLLKTDAGGHEDDHTVVGRQAWIWDVAGALVEWGLNKESIALLVNATQQTAVTTIPHDVLTWYCLAYAAFRVGQTSLCANMSGHDPNEQTRLWRAFDFYKTTLAHCLQA